LQVSFPVLMAASNMIEYKKFVDELKSELNSYANKPKYAWAEKAVRYVNGYAAEELRRLVSLEKRRKDGIFFTDSELAKKVLTLLKPSFNKDSVIYDAACGVGNLLISVSDYMRESGINPVKPNYLLGTDIHVEFTEAAAFRLQMNTLLHTSINGDTITSKVKLNSGYDIRQVDGLIDNEYYKAASHIFINPPFNQEKIKEKLNWSSGKISMAAVFMYKSIQFAKPGTIIMAILPDVLRSGTRYEKWREMIKTYCIMQKTELLGQFDQYADVDVYAVKMIKRKKLLKKQEAVNNDAICPAAPQTLKDLFDICVGPVVDFRDEKKGPRRPYIISKGLKSWGVQTEITETRKNKGKCFEGPFVVIKRTSRATDSYRAMATIIKTAESVYVDNHLIILKPKACTLAACKSAIKILKDEKTNKWLNEEIRCRHLTVKVVSEIPIW